MRSFFYFIFSLFISIFPFRKTYSTSFYIPPFPKTVQEAPIIIRGTVGTSYSDWAKDAQGNKKLYTFYEIQPYKVFKGEADPKPFIIRELGGEKDGVKLIVPGVSKYEKNEDVVLFLNQKNRENIYEVKGMMLGKYEIKKNEKDEEYLEGPGISMQNTEDELDPQDLSSNTQTWTLTLLEELIKSQSLIDKSPIPTTIDPILSTQSPSSTQPLLVSHFSPVQKIQTIFTFLKKYFIWILFLFSSVFISLKWIFKKKWFFSDSSNYKNNNE